MAVEFLQRRMNFFFGSRSEMVFRVLLILVGAVWVSSSFSPPVKIGIEPAVPVIGGYFDSFDSVPGVDLDDVPDLFSGLRAKLAGLGSIATLPALAGEFRMLCSRCIVCMWNATTTCG